MTARNQQSSPRRRHDAGASMPEKLTEDEMYVVVEEIRREHEAVETGVRATVEAAIRCGQLLHEAKAQVDHGKWLPWLEANFPASKRTAQVYMRLADRAEDAQDLAHLGIEGAAKQLAAPKPDREEADQAEDRDHYRDAVLELCEESEWHRQRIEKTEERFYGAVIPSVNAIAKALPEFRLGKFYPAALHKIEPELLREVKHEIKEARKALRDLEQDLDRVLRGLSLWPGDRRGRGS